MSLKQERIIARALRQELLANVNTEAAAILGIGNDTTILSIPTRADPILARVLALSAVETTGFAQAAFSKMNVESMAGKCWHWLAWAEVGCPAFVLSQGLTASLLLTEPSVRPPEEMKLPFDAIVIVLPPEIPLQFKMGATTDQVARIGAAWVPAWKNADELGRYKEYVGRRDPAAISKLLVSAEFGEIFYSDLTSTAGSCFHFTDPSHLVCSEEWLSGTCNGHLLDEGDQSAAVLKNRLILNLLDYLECEHGRADLASATERTKFNREKSIHLGTEINLPAPGRFLRSLGPDETTWHLEHKFMVRGHWRMQPYGPAHSLRRRTWIMPFWKGPEDAVATADRIYRVAEKEIR
jgi:hypothetical protein